MKTIKLLFFVVLTLSLVSCGKRGPLKLPLEKSNYADNAK